METKTAVSPQLIEKEMIVDLSFKDQITVEQHPNLMKQIADATRLGNTFRTKVSIIFHDDSGPKSVYTTIWASGTRFICLKGGVWIPIGRIAEVRI